MPRQYFKKLEGTDDLWEVRADFGGDALPAPGFLGFRAANRPDPRLCQEDSENARAGNRTRPAAET